MMKIEMVIIIKIEIIIITMNVMKDFYVLSICFYKMSLEIGITLEIRK